MTTEEEMTQFRRKVERATGSGWCPYPSALMVRVVNAVDDAVVERLVEIRRQYPMPAFLDGDPMHEQLAAIEHRLTHHGDMP